MVDVHNDGLSPACTVSYVHRTVQHWFASNDFLLRSNISLQIHRYTNTMNLLVAR